MAVCAVDGVGSVLESVQDAWEPAVVPVGGCGELGVGLLVGGLPGKPQGGELFDNLGVLGPARRDLLGEWVPVPDPADPVAELLMEFLGALFARVRQHQAVGVGGRTVG